MNRVGLTAGLITTMDQMRSQKEPLERGAREGRQEGQTDGLSDGQSDGRIKPAPAGATTNDLKLTNLTLEIEYLNKYVFFF